MSHSSAETLCFMRDSEHNRVLFSTVGRQCEFACTPPRCTLNGLQFVRISFVCYLEKGTS